MLIVSRTCSTDEWDLLGFLSTRLSNLSSGWETWSILANGSPQPCDFSAKKCALASLVIRSWLDYQPFFFFISIYKKNGRHRLCSRRRLNCPVSNLVSATARWGVARRKKKKHTGCTINESWLLELLHSTGFGGRWCWCGALGRMECFNGNAETCAVEGKDVFVPTSLFWRSLHPLGCDKIPNDNNQGT